jgi:hypothetical protein
MRICGLPPLSQPCTLLSPSPASSASARLYTKLRLVTQVHPDKSTLPGAVAAFKLLNAAKECLLDSAARGKHDARGPAGPLGKVYGPAVAEPEARRPRVVRVQERKRRHGLVSFVFPGGLGFRVAFRSALRLCAPPPGAAGAGTGDGGGLDGAGSAELRRFLSDAWERRGADGVLRCAGGRNYAVGLVRLQAKEAWSDGETRVKLVRVVGDAAGNGRDAAGGGRGVWEVEVGRWGLKEAEGLLVDAFRTAAAGKARGGSEGEGGCASESESDSRAALEAAAERVVEELSRLSGSAAAICRAMGPK